MDIVRFSARGEFQGCRADGVADSVDTLDVIFTHAGDRRLTQQRGHQAYSKIETKYCTGAASLPPDPV